MEASSKAIAFVMELAAALHRFGTPAHRLELITLRVAKNLGMAAQVLTTPTFILASFGETHETRLARVEPGEVELGKLMILDELTSKVGRGELSVEEGVMQVR